MTTEPTTPDYYRAIINGTQVDVIDIALAYSLPITLGLALKYIVRIKGDNNKRINDLEKAIECLNREINYLKQDAEEIRIMRRTEG